MVNAELLGKMKETAFLINTSRGPVINEADLYEALKNGQLAGAGLDVSAEEPTGPGNPLLELDNCVITPHISWATATARRLMQTTVDNIEAFEAASRSTSSARQAVKQPARRLAGAGSSRKRLTRGR